MGNAVQWESHAGRARLLCWRTIRLACLIKPGLHRGRCYEMARRPRVRYRTTAARQYQS
jgi:hypothetical protein